MTRILVTGRTGQVGSALYERLATRKGILFVDRNEMNIAHPEDVHLFLRQIEPEVIINAAAYTAVDQAESDENMARCVNRDGVLAMAEWVDSVGGLLVHYSTDYVFDGSKAGAYVEDDAANPLSVYGRTKWEGEEVIRESGCRHLILRTSWVIARQGKNFIRTILRLGAERETLNVVNDQYGAPTSADLITDSTLALLDKIELEDHRLGTYHLVASGLTDWHAFACFILEVAAEMGLPLKLKPEAVQAIPSSAYPVAAKRPHNSHLANDKIRQEFGIQLPAWQEGAERVIRAIVAEIMQK